MKLREDYFALVISKNEDFIRNIKQYKRITKKL